MTAAAPVSTCSPPAPIDWAPDEFFSLVMGGKVVRAWVRGHGMTVAEVQPRADGMRPAGHVVRMDEEFRVRTDWFKVTMSEPIVSFDHADAAVFRLIHRFEQYKVVLEEMVP